jgi:hypothetical protein
MTDKEDWVDIGSAEELARTPVASENSIRWSDGSSRIRT